MSFVPYLLYREAASRLSAAFRGKADNAFCLAYVCFWPKRAYAGSGVSSFLPVTWADTMPNPESRLVRPFIYFTALKGSLE